jgi:hypothetical protein
MEEEVPVKKQLPGKASKNMKNSEPIDLDDLDIESEEYGHFRYEDDEGQKKREQEKIRKELEEKNNRRKKANQANIVAPRISNYPS